MQAMGGAGCGRRAPDRRQPGSVDRFTVLACSEGKTEKRVPPTEYRGAPSLFSVFPTLHRNHSPSAPRPPHSLHKLAHSVAERSLCRSLLAPSLSINASGDAFARGNAHISASSPVAAAGLGLQRLCRKFRGRGYSRLLSALHARDERGHRPIPLSTPLSPHPTADIMSSSAIRLTGG